MHLGIEEGWDDGVCCTGVLTRATPEEAAKALGTPVEVVKDGATVATSPEGARAFALRSPGPSEWTIVEWARPHNMDDDYLLPMFLEVEAVVGGAAPDSEPSVFRYETPIAIAARLARETGAPSIALWGSDEWPGLSGAAFFGADGKLEDVYSAYDGPAIAKAHAGRRRLSDNAANYEDDIDDSEETEGRCFRLRRRKGAQRVKKSVTEVVSEELTKRQAGFDNLDLLSDLAESLEAGQPCEHATSLWVAV